ncbi:MULTISPECIES: DUF4123 domain-containing protein, partial [unclassified Pseudomonas]|uniref:DUF4123 domain-containing protein n=1 Tax=unclassified Pseudomonas TaxID=196821 RepID=UPI0035C1761F
MKNDFETEILLPLRESDRYQLAAILELSRLDAEQLEALAQYQNRACWSLMQQDELSNLRRFGPAVYAPTVIGTPQGQSDFFWQVKQFASHAIGGWVVSSLKGAELARHLAQANNILAPDGKRYLLRYHTQQCLKVLSSRMDLPDLREWFAPLHSWWVPYPDAETATWFRISGYDRPAARALNGLALDQRCWQALVADSLSYRLADQLEHGLEASGKPAQCHGLRLGMAQKHLVLARQAGFVEQHDLLTYATCMALQGERLAPDPIWHTTVKQALATRQPLIELLQAHLPHSLD